MLSEKEIDAIISNYRGLMSGRVIFTEQQIADTKEVFYDLMSEDIHKNKTLDQQEDLITYILAGWRKNETKEFQKRDLSEVKHIAFFDNFLQEGEGGKVYRALKDNGLPTSVLRGITPNNKIKLKVQTDKGLLSIEGRISFSPNGEDEYEDYMQLTLNGQVIYSWERDEDLQDEIKQNAEVNEEEEKKIIESKGKHKPKNIKRKYNKDGTKRKSVYLRSTILSDGREITTEVMSNGQKANRDSKTGRFAKKI